eukprot:tig00000269_g23721.t1
MISIGISHARLHATRYATRACRRETRIALFVGLLFVAQLAIASAAEEWAWEQVVGRGNEAARVSFPKGAPAGYGTHVLQLRTVERFESAQKISVALYSGLVDPDAPRGAADPRLISEAFFASGLEFDSIVAENRSTVVASALATTVSVRYAYRPRAPLSPLFPEPPLGGPQCSSTSGSASPIELFVPIFPFVDPIVGRVALDGLTDQGPCGSNFAGCRLSLFGAVAGWAGLPTPAAPSARIEPGGEFSVPPFAPRLNGTAGARLAAFVVPASGPEHFVDGLPSIPPFLAEEAIASRKAVLWAQSAVYDANAQAGHERLVPMCLRLDPPGGGLGDDGVSAYYVNGTGSLRRAEEQCGAELAECTLYVFSRGEFWELVAEPARPVLEACGPVSARAIRVEPGSHAAIAGSTQLVVVLLQNKRLDRLAQFIRGATGSAERFPNRLQNLQPYAVQMLVLERSFVPWKCIGWFPKRTDVADQPFTAQPGPNFWSGDPRDVRLRPDGFHLNINKRNGKWWATEMVTDEYFYYGLYYFVVNEAAHVLPALDPNLIMGLYVYEEEGTWIEPGVAEWPYREIDLEFGKFGAFEEGDSSDAQFVVMPFEPPGNLQRYRVRDLFQTDAQWTPDKKVTAAFLWGPDGVQFWAYKGVVPVGEINAESAQPRLVSKWKSTASTPWPRHNRVRINIWMWGGQEPQSSTAPAEVAVGGTERTITGGPLIVHDFVHVPLSNRKPGADCLASGEAVSLQETDLVFPVSATYSIGILGTGFSPSAEQNAVRLSVDVQKDGRILRLSPTCVVTASGMEGAYRFLQCRTDDPGVVGVLKDFGKSMGLSELGVVRASVSVCGGPWSPPAKIGVVSREKAVPCYDYRASGLGPQLPEPKKCKLHAGSTFCECPRTSGYYNFEGSDGIGGYGACAPRDPSAARTCPKGLHRYLGAPTAGEARRVASNTVCLSKGKMPCFRHYPDCPDGMELSLEKYVRFEGQDPVKDRKEDVRCVCRANPSRHYALSFSLASPALQLSRSDSVPSLATEFLAGQIASLLRDASTPVPFCSTELGDVETGVDARPVPSVSAVWIRDAIRALVLFTDDLFGAFPESWTDYKLLLRPDLEPASVHGGDFVYARVLPDWRAIQNYSFGDTLLGVRRGSAGNTVMFVLGPKASKDRFQRALGASFGSLPNATRIVSWQTSQEVLALIKEDQSESTVSAAEVSWRLKVAHTSGARLQLRSAAPAPAAGAGGGRRLSQDSGAAVAVDILDVTDDPEILYDTFPELYRPPETRKGLPWIPPVVVCGLIIIFTTVFLVFLYMDLKQERQEKRRNRRWLEREDLEVSAAELRKISAAPNRKVRAGRRGDQDEEEMQPLKAADGVAPPPSPGAASGSHVVLQMRRRDGDAAADDASDDSSSETHSAESADESIGSNDVGDGIKRHLSLSEMKSRMRRLDEKTKTILEKPRDLGALWSEDGQPPPSARSIASTAAAGAGLPVLPKAKSAPAGSGALLQVPTAVTNGGGNSHRTPAASPRPPSPAPYQLPARPKPAPSARAEVNGIPVFGPEDGVLYKLQAVIKHLDEVTGFSADVQQQAARLVMKEVTDAVEGARDRQGDFEGRAVLELHNRKLHANREWFYRMSFALPGALSIWSRFVRMLGRGLTSALFHVPTFAKYAFISIVKAWRRGGRRGAAAGAGAADAEAAIDDEQLNAMLVNLFELKLVNLYLCDLVFVSASNFRSCPSFLSYLFYAAKRLLAIVQNSAGEVRERKMPPGAYVKLEVSYWHRVFSCAKMFRANTRSQQDYMTYSDLTELYELPRFVLDATKYSGNRSWGEGLGSLGGDDAARDAAIARRLEYVHMDAWCVNRFSLAWIGLVRMRAHAIVSKRCGKGRLCFANRQKYYPEPIDYESWSATLRSSAEYDKEAVDKALSEIATTEKDKLALSAACRRALARALQKSIKEFEGLVSSALDESHESLADDEQAHRIPLKLKQRLLELAGTVRADAVTPVESNALPALGFRKQVETSLRKFVDGVAAELKKYDVNTLLPACRMAVDSQARAIGATANDLLRADDSRFKLPAYRHSHVWLKTFDERSRSPLLGMLSLISNTMPVFEIGCLRYAAHIPTPNGDIRLLWVLLGGTYVLLQLLKFLLWWWLLPPLSMCREVVKPRLTVSAASNKETIDGLARWAVLFAIEAVVILCDHFLVFQPLADANYFPEEGIATWQQGLWIACIAFTCWVPTIFSFFISSNVAYVVILDLIAVLKGWIQGFEKIKSWEKFLGNFGAIRERFWVRVSLSRRKSVSVRERCRAWAMAWSTLLADLKERHLLKVAEYDRLRYRPLPPEHVDRKRDEALVLEHDRKYLDQMQNSTGPENAEARRRIHVWASGLLMNDLPDSASLRQARSLTVLIPAGDEAVIYAERDLLETDASGICALEHIIDMHPNEWTILVDELQRRADDEQREANKMTTRNPFAAPARPRRDAAALEALRRLSESKLRGEVLLCWNDLTADDQLAIRWWASMRFQPLARTLFGICSYFKAYDLLARMHYPTVYDDPDEPAPLDADQPATTEAAILRTRLDRERHGHMTAAHQDAAAREKRQRERDALVASKVQVIFAYQNFQDRITAADDLALVDDLVAKQRARQPLSDDEKAIFTAWASWDSDASSTLTDFKLKAAEVRAALLAGAGSLASLEKTKGEEVRQLRAQGGRLAESAEDRRKAGDAKTKALDNRLKYNDVCGILKRFPKLELVYIDKSSNSSVRVMYDPLADNARGPSSEAPPLKEISRVKMAGDPMLMYPKGENQNHALIFCENQVIQAIDCNQDFFVEEALKVPALLEEFTHDSSIRIIGFPEFVITTDWNLVARMSGVSERVFTTATQRALAMVGVRNHYGHPDYIEATYVRTNGGMSNTQYVSEDIFKGFDAQLTGGRIIQVEYMQGGKARDTSMLTTYKFMSKISQGAAQMSMAREFGYLLVSGNISFTKRTFLWAPWPGASSSLGGFTFTARLCCLIPPAGRFNTTVTNFLTQGLFVKYGVLIIVLSRCIMSIVQPITRWIVLPNSFDLANLVTFIYVGFPMALPLLFENILVQKKPLLGLWATVRDFVALSLYHSFHLVTFAVGFYNGLRSNAAYIPSGRGFGLQHDPATDLVAAFYEGHLRYALFLLALIIGPRAHLT